MDDGGVDGGAVQQLDPLLQLDVGVAAVGDLPVVHVEVGEPPRAVAEERQPQKGRQQRRLALRQAPPLYNCATATGGGWGGG